MFAQSEERVQIQKWTKEFSHDTIEYFKNTYYTLLFTSDIQRCLNKV